MSRAFVPPLALALAVALACPAAQAARFVYEGRLDDLGQPANGRYDLRLGAFGHEKLGATLAAPITVEGVDVRDGRFRLEVDLPLVETESVWLEVAVRESGSPVFSPIPGRSKAIAAPLIGACWSTTGDSGSNPSVNFLGTTDDQPLVLRTRNSQSMRIEPAPASGPNRPNLIAGSAANFVSSGVRGATIAGGGCPSGAEGPGTNPNAVTGNFGTVGGGHTNVAGITATIGGGIRNTASGESSTIGGGQANTVAGLYGTIAGGESNSAGGLGASVGGGQANVANGTNSSIAGGSNNAANAANSTVGGGSQNNASGLVGTVGGGEGNHASGSRSTVPGGLDNTASGARSTVGGGESNCAGGSWSWAGGRRAKVRVGSTSGAPGTGCTGVANSGDADGDNGSFVWADSQNADFVSSGADQFLVRADGGVMFNTNALPSTNDDLVVKARPTGGDADADLRLVSRNNRSVTLYVTDASGSLVVSPLSLTAGADRISVGGGTVGAATLSHGGTWTNASSRVFKEGFQSIDPLDVLERVLALDIQRWRYKGSTEGEHLGPVAEDFHAAFGLGNSAERIATVDADGVALAAIQGLHRKFEAERDALKAENAAIDGGQSARIAALEAENAELRERLARIEAQLASQRPMD